MQQIAQKQGYSFYTTFSVNRKGEIRVKMLTKAGLKQVKDNENWEIGIFEKNEINLLKSDDNKKRKTKASKPKNKTKK
jgi:hypothetical protein